MSCHALMDKLEKEPVAVGGSVGANCGGSLPSRRKERGAAQRELKWVGPFQPHGVVAP